MSSDAPAQVRRAPDDAAPPRRHDPLFWIIALLAAVDVALTAWTLLGLSGSASISRLTGVPAFVCGVVIVGIGLRMRRSPRRDAGAHRTWSMITLGLISYGVGSMIHTAAGLASDPWPLTPIGSVFQLATYPLVAFALATLPRSSKTRSDLVLFWLDVLIVAWSAAMLVWHFIFYPIGREAGVDLAATTGAAIFPVFDLTLIFATGALVFRGLRTTSQSALRIAAGSLLLIFAGDMAAGIEILRGTYVQGGAAGAFYSLGWLGILVACFAQARANDREGPETGLTGYSRSFVWLPYLAVAMAFIAPTVRDWNDLDLLRQHLPATGFLIAMLVARLGVTAYQNASLAVAERERLAAAVEQAAEVILTTDPAGNITYVNPAFSRITGYESSEVIGRTWAYMSGDVDPVLMAQIGRALTSGNSWEGRLVQRRRDGSSVELDLALSPMRDASSAVVGFVEVARDISRERALEAQLAQAQRMEAVGRLAGGIAHDFNNILTAISGFGELASDELPPDHPAAVDIAEVLRASDRAASLTSSLLAFSRRQVMQPRLVDLNDILASLTPMLSRLIGENIQLQVRNDPNLGTTLADRAQIEQVVLNLSVNARDAMPSGGTLTIVTSNEDIDAEYARTQVGASAGRYVALSVSDTGIGMSSDLVEHVFEPFFTTKARGKGTGLGLSTVIGIVQQSGGFVVVDSLPQVGSTFGIFLPRAEGAVADEAAATAIDRTAGGTETILVAEDEVAVRQLVERVLRGAGYRVITAANGREALSLAPTLPKLDLLFTDVVMPGMSGIELAARISAEHPGVRVVFVSGYSDEALPLDGEHGRIPYIPKPFTSEKLLAQVRAVLDGRPLS